MSGDDHFIRPDNDACEPPICCYCDNYLSCANCGREQPADYPAAIAEEVKKLRVQLEKARALLKGVTKIAKRNEWSVDIIEAETFLAQTDEQGNSK